MNSIKYLVNKTLQKQDFVREFLMDETLIKTIAECYTVPYIDRFVWLEIINHFLNQNSGIHTVIDEELFKEYLK